MNENKLKRARVRIDGMTCASCEILLERKLSAVPGVVRVDVSHRRGCADIYYVDAPRMSDVQRAISDTKYSVSAWKRSGSQQESAVSRNTPYDYFEIGSIFLIVMGLYFILSRLKIIPEMAVSESMGYGGVFLIGLVAAASTCMAVAGGLLLGVMARYSEQHAHFSRFRRFQPNLYFNLGRILSYAGFGAAIGLVGSAFSFSPQLTGFITIGASIVMILLGFNLLQIFPRLGSARFALPKSFSHRIHALSERHPKVGPLLLGASTFFLPCGFTQALQLYVLSTGDPLKGAITMTLFALGTLPALLGIGAISSLVKGRVQRIFLKVAGVIVLLLGVFNIGSGMTLAGISISFPNMQKDERTAPLPIVDGVQRADMTVRGYDYYPHRFTVVQGVPVEWRIDGRAAAGCGSVLFSPKLNIVQQLKPDGITTVSFVPQETGEFPFNCGMGMMTRGSGFTVIPKN